MMNIRRYEPKKSENVVVLCIDQKSLGFISKVMLQSWPWPREFHAQIVRYLSACGARAVLFDIIFSEPDHDRVNASTGEECDAELGNAIEESGVTYLSAALQDSVSQNPYSDDIFLADNDIFNKLLLKNHESAVFSARCFNERCRRYRFCRLFS